MELADLVDTLKWDGSGMPRGWRALYVTRLRELLGGWEKTAPRSLAQAFEALPEQQQEGVLMSPNVTWRLLHQEFSDLGYWFGLECLRRLSIEDYPLSGIQVVHGIDVDFASEYECPPRSEKAENLLPLSEAEGSHQSNRISTGLVALRSARPAAYDFVLTETNRIVVRKYEEVRTRFASGSFSEHAGLTYIYGVDRISDAQVVDAVTHESIHAAIYMYEPLMGALVPRKSDSRIVSPWSGNPLTLDQYVQACFVWWGLLNLWSGWNNARALYDDSEVARLRDRAAKGFMARPAQRMVAEVGPVHFSLEALASLRLIEELSFQHATLLIS